MTLIATIKRTVVVHHRFIALVDIRRCEIEHMVMEPVCAHGFSPVTANLNATVLITLLPTRRFVVHIQRLTGNTRCCSTWLICRGINAVMTRKRYRPAIIVELTRIEKCTGHTVTFCRIMTIVFVGSNGVHTKPSVGRHINR